MSVEESSGLCNGGMDHSYPTPSSQDSKIRDVRRQQGESYPHRDSLQILCVRASSLIYIHLHTR
jgi:hypothetical protein